MSTLKKQQEISKKGQTVPVAIVGMAGIFPQAENIKRYWANIMQEVNCITEVPHSRWPVEDYYDPDPQTPDKSYSKHGGFIPDIEFDPMEFGLPPNFLEVTDVSQLLGLVVARDALADAGYPDKGKEIFDRTGVILGMVGMSSKVIQPLLNRLQYPIWEKALRSSSMPQDEIPQVIEKIKLAYIGWNENAFPGAIGNVVAGRIANRFDLRGTNCIVDAACGSSLAAVSMAINELALGRSDMMITGGVDTDNSILTYLCFSKTPAFSKGDRLRAFSEESDGMLVGEGVGMLVLKRLDDAEKDGDRIYAVIRGVGTSSDGYFKSIYAPRPSGQAKALERAYEAAGYSPKTVGLIEAHGTGTNAGDPAEFEGLRQAFSGGNTQNQHIALGSVKSQIGHTKATAGAASLIKASLALHHKVLPATINVSKPHPAMDIENSPFYLNTQTRPWFRRADGEPRRAGVSSFGFGGTNFHLAVEEYQNGSREFVRLQPTPYTVFLTAPTPESLGEVCRKAAEDLAGEDAEAILNGLDEASSVKEVAGDHARLGFVAQSLEDAREKMTEAMRLLETNKGQDSWTHPKGIFFRSSGLEPEGKTVALFPGQGSQYVNMGLELAINFPAFREVFENANASNIENEGEVLTNVVYPIPVFSEDERKTQQEKLTATENAQPAIGTFSMALYRLLQAAGFQADFFAGHSFGELTALWASGVLEDDAFLRLAAARGRAMSKPAGSGKDTGSMAAVKGQVEQIRDLIKDVPDIKIANFNSPSQVVLAGSTEAIKDIQPVLEKAGMAVYPLDVSAAFHTQFVGHAQEPFSKAIQKEKFHPAKGKVFSNTSAQPYPSEVDSAAVILSDHILHSVRFQEEIENIYEDGGRIFIEIGPKHVLSSLVKDILGDKPHEIVALNPNAKGGSDMQLRQAVVQMRVLGFKLGQVDPYKSHEIVKRPAASKVAVKLNGGLYKTEATKQRFEQALEEKARKRQAVDAPTQPKTNNDPLPAKAKLSIRPSDSQSPVEEKAPAPPANATEIEALIEKLQTHQAELLRTHQQFLKNDSISNTLMQQITGMELSLLSGNNGSRPDERALNAIEKQTESLSSQHEATSSAHQAYIQSQTEFTREYAELIKGLMHAPVPLKPAAHPVVNAAVDKPAEKSTVHVSGPSDLPTSEVHAASVQAAAKTTQAVSSRELSTAFLEIVSEKTGYPVDMLELEMDMEADLGIDSIKRVEILGAMQEKYPELPSIGAEELVELRTLTQVIGAFQIAPTSSEKSPVVQEAHEMKEPSVQTSAQSIDSEEIQRVFLDIVSEKTGYPVDMLELSMDMEADLGIDSIKRVEILGAVQEKYPDLPTISAEQLVELRTLEQVIGAFKVEKTSKESVEPSQNSLTSQSSKEPEKSAENPGADKIQAAFLDIVSEKTGYPVDMLELNMDMEADLGIDSIKRVEILGATQEKFPDLPSISAEELVELRTLGQIIEKFSSTEPSEAIPASNDTVEPQFVNESQINVLPVTTRQLPRPDQVVFDYPEGSAVLITAGDQEKTRQLAETFTSQGLKVGLIHLSPNGNSKTPENPGVITHYTLEDASEKGLKSLMEKVTGEHKKIIAFLHIEPAHNNGNEQLVNISDEGEQSLKSVFLMAGYLKAPLTEAADETRPAFLTITQMDGQFGLNGYQAADPMPGGFAGLTKTLRQEWPNVFCRALDFHPEMNAKDVAARIQDELHDADLRLSEVGYTPDGRFTVALADTPEDGSGGNV